MISPAVNWENSAAEWHHLSDHYRRMSDGELLKLAEDKSELTGTAQQCLEDEISQRKLTPEPEPEAPAEPAVPLNPIYDDDRELVEICSVWSAADALQVQNLLDQAGIPFYMGKEQATGVDGVTSNFSTGVSVQIMKVGLPWARDPMSHYVPLNEPKEEQPGELEDMPVRCPKCNSDAVILEHLADDEEANPAAAPKFEWTCDSCGYEWEDDGVVKK
jgi:DNA-directed RNA polymerase subunit M/transcription elongation factor TFIIS